MVRIVKHCYLFLKKKSLLLDKLHFFENSRTTFTKNVVNLFMSIWIWEGVQAVFAPVVRWRQEEVLPQAGSRPSSAQTLSTSLQLSYGSLAQVDACKYANSQGPKQYTKLLYCKLLLSQRCLAMKDDHFWQHHAGAPKPQMDQLDKDELNALKHHVNRSWAYHLFA